MLVGIDGNARAEQDLVTVIIPEQMASQVSAVTKATRASSVNAGIGSLLGVRNKIVAANPNMGGEIFLGPVLVLILMVMPTPVETACCRER